MNMFVNDFILNACVKTTEMFICEKILTTSGNKITSKPRICIVDYKSLSKPYTNGDKILSVV